MKLVKCSLVVSRTRYLWHIPVSSTEDLRVGAFWATMPPEALEITRKFVSKPVSCEYHPRRKSGNSRHSAITRSIIFVNTIGERWIGSQTKWEDVTTQSQLRHRGMDRQHNMISCIKRVLVCSSQLNVADLQWRRSSHCHWRIKVYVVND